MISRMRPRSAAAAARFARLAARSAIAPAALANCPLTLSMAPAASSLSFMSTPGPLRELPAQPSAGDDNVSKHRFIAAQLERYLADGLWLALARHANDMADRLAAGLAAA